MRAILDKMESISELTDGALRGIRKTAEDPPRVSVLDVISALTGLEIKGSSVVYHRLKEQFPEVAIGCCNFKFPGRGQRETLVTCAKGATLILMLLPCRVAKQIHKQAAYTLVRYLGGDLSMVDEIAQNHLAQQDLDEDHAARIFGQTAERDRVKRAREGVTLSELELQVGEKTGALKRRKIESIQFCLEAFESIGGADQRDKLTAIDMIRIAAILAKMQEAKDKRHDARMTAIQEHTTEVGEKTTNDVNLHTTTKSDRVIEAVRSLVEANTQPSPDKIQMAAKLASTSTTVGILNPILLDEGVSTKGSKEEKAAYFADSVPAQRLITLRAEHAGTATRKTKANKSGAQSEARNIGDVLATNETETRGRGR